jgi:formiminotetrahydrofolate cyclodeaminase
LAVSDTYPAGNRPGQTKDDDNEKAEQRISDFLERLASDAPAPGGGSAAALNGALGAALVHMVAALTAEKARYAQFEALAQELLRESQKLMDEFLVLIDRDIAAFSVVAGVYAMPKGTEDEKAVRRAAMQEALRGGAAPPLALMRCALDALKLTKRAVGHSNPNVASDLGVAALNLKAAPRAGGSTWS